MGLTQVRAEKVGEILRRTRDTRQISLEEVAKKTKISMRFLTALEKADYKILPSDVFVRGFLRSYARTLGLDPEEIVELYKQEQGIAASRADEENVKPLPLFLLWITLGVIGVVLAAALVFVLWPRAKTPNLSIPQEPAPAMEPAAAPSAKPSTPSAPAPIPPTHVLDSVELLFSRHCWVLVKADNVKAFEGFKESGDQLKYEIRSSFYLKVGDAGAVQVTHNAKAYPRLGDEGQPVELNITATGGRP
jgi:cytoskeletal protein RodZ